MGPDCPVDLPEMPSRRELREPVGGRALAAIRGRPDRAVRVDRQPDAVPDSACERQACAARAKREDDPARAGPLREAADTDVDRVVGADRDPLAPVDAVRVGKLSRATTTRAPRAPCAVPDIPVELVGLGHVQHRPSVQHVEREPLRIRQPGKKRRSAGRRSRVPGRVEPDDRPCEWPADEQRPVRRPDRKPRIGDTRPHLRRPSHGDREPAGHTERRTGVSGI